MYRNYEQHAADGRFVALPGTARVDGEIGNALHA
jgi:hypothetical protein